MKDLFGKIIGILNISGRDFKIFIFSLLLAYGIWLIHNLTLYYTEVVSIPVRAVCRIDGHSGISSNDALVQCRCRITGFNLISFAGKRKKPVTVRFSAQDMHRGGGDVFYVTNADLDKYTSQIFGGRVKLETYLSDTLTFRFPVENHKKVPVAVESSITFASQYMGTGPIAIEPDSVTVYGEPYHIDAIDRVFTEPVRLKNLRSSARGEVRLCRVKGVRLSDESVKYSVGVTRYVEFSSTLQVYCRNIPGGRSLTVYPPAAEVRFRCAFPISADPAESVRIYVDYNDFRNSLGGQCIPKVDGIPEGVLDVRIEPDVFDCVEGGR